MHTHFIFLQWTARTCPSEVGGSPSVWYDVAWSPSLALIVVVGSGGGVISSADGITVNIRHFTVRLCRPGP